MNKTKVVFRAILLLVMAGSRSVVAQEVSICNEAKIAKMMRGKYASYRVVRIDALFGEGHGSPVIVNRKPGETIPVTVRVQLYEGKKPCDVDPTRLSYEWRYEGVPSDEAGIRMVGPGRFSFPMRNCLTCDLSLTVTHEALGQEVKPVFEPVLVWTPEQEKLNELMNSLRRVLNPGHDELLDPPQAELADIGKAIGRAMDLLDDNNFDEALISIQEVRDRIGTLPGGIKWKPSLDTIDDVAAATKARKARRKETGE